MGKRFKAAILVEQRKPLVVDEVELPEKLEYGQVLVRVHYTTICGSQLNEIDGQKGPDKFLPHLLGHEGGGVVESCGPGVTTVKPGDHVVLHWRKGAGVQSATPQYRRGDSVVNAGWVTTFNEYAIVSENRVTSIPKDFDLAIAPLYGCALTTAFGTLHNNAHIRSGDSLLIVGAGGVGGALVLMARLAGAYPIIAADVNRFKLERARQLGATHTVNSKEEDLRERIKAMLPGGVDVVIDTTGITAVAELGYELTSDEGTMVTVGVQKRGEKMSIDAFPLLFSKRLVGSHGGESNPARDIPRLIRLQQSGGFDTRDLITHTFPLEKINEAIQLVRSGDALRCMIKLV